MPRPLNDAEKIFVSDVIARFSHHLRTEDDAARDSFLKVLGDAGIISTPFGYRVVGQSGGEAE